MRVACKSLNYATPTPIQSASLPYSLSGRDLIALAETGSGKTLAFALPLVQALLASPSPFFALVLAPARELVVQIADHLRALGAQVGLKVAVIIGATDLKSQAKALSSGPHVVVGTPGKVLYHMQNSRCFGYQQIRCLVMDEADKLLSDDFAGQLDRIVEALSPNRQTLLFSATMTDRVEKL
ncbi:unnamed protein product [Sphagnum balticum]